VSQAVIWPLVISALGVVIVRRRLMAIVLGALQSLLLGAEALSNAAGASTALLVGSLVLVAKAIVLPGLLALVVSRTREPGRMASERHLLARLTVALAVALAVVTLVPRFGLAHANVEHAAVGLVALGIATAVLRRPAIFQAFGFLVAENGLYLAALSVPGGLPVFIELGLVFDLVVVVSVAGAFSAKIHEELGTGDTSLLGSLRD
jgi:hydrogenase-4 component E